MSQLFLVLQWAHQTLFGLLSDLMLRIMQHIAQPSQLRGAEFPVPAFSMAICNDNTISTRERGRGPPSAPGGHAANEITDAELFAEERRRQQGGEQQQEQNG